MKIVITGHTKGIGKGLYDHFSKQNEVIGFSKSTGYDIKTPADQDAIISASNDADIFINNAYLDDNQLILGNKWFDKNKDRNCLIVNMGSISIEYPNYDINNTLSKYINNKNNLAELSWKINISNNSAKSILVNPGIVDTEMAEHTVPLYHKKFKEKGILISVKQVTDIVVYSIENYNSSVFIPHISIFNNIK